MPDTRVGSPLFSPLGYITPPIGPSRYYFMIDGRVRCYRAWELQSMPFLLELHPDVTHWRDLFPGFKRGRVDTLAAASHFMRLCRAKGLIEPIPESLPDLSDRVSK